MTDMLKLTNRECEIIAHNVWPQQFPIDFVEFGHEAFSTYVGGAYKPECVEVSITSCMPGTDLTAVKAMFSAWLFGLKACGINMIVVRQPPTVSETNLGAVYVHWRAAFFRSSEEYMDSDLYRAKQLHEQGKAK